MSELSKLNKETAIEAISESIRGCGAVHAEMLLSSGVELSRGDKRLNSCPCGSGAKVDNSESGFWIACTDCGLRSGRYRWSEPEDRAIAQWNKMIQPTISDYLASRKEMLDKTGAKMVTVKSLVDFMEKGNE